MSLPGAFSQQSAIAATLFLLWLQREQRARLPAYQAAIRAGLREARWPGRLEVIQHDPSRHRPSAIPPTASAIARKPMAIHGAKTGSRHRCVWRQEGEGNYWRACASFDTIIGTAAHHKGADAQVIAAAARRGNPKANIMSLRQCGRRAALAGDGSATKATRYGRRVIPGGRIRDRRKGRPRGGFGVFLNVAHNPRSRPARPRPVRPEAPE